MTAPCPSSQARDGVHGRPRPAPPPHPPGHHLDMLQCSLPLHVPSHHHPTEDIPPITEIHFRRRMAPPLPRRPPRLLHPRDHPAPEPLLHHLCHRGPAQIVSRPHHPHRALSPLPVPHRHPLLDRPVVRQGRLPRPLLQAVQGAGPVPARVVRSRHLHAARVRRVRPDAGPVVRGRGQLLRVRRLRHQGGHLEVQPQRVLQHRHRCLHRLVQ